MMPRPASQIYPRELFITICTGAAIPQFGTGEGAPYVVVSSGMWPAT